MNRSSRNGEQATRLVQNREALAKFQDLKHICVLLLVLCYAAACASGTSPASEEESEQPGVQSPIQATQLAIVSRDSVEQARYNIAVVQDEAGHREGLSAFAPLDPGQGLVLAWEVPQRICIWNQPVSYAIDVAFLAADRTVLAIEQFDAEESRSRCYDAVIEVLETRQGQMANLAPGDFVQYNPL